MKQVAHRDMPRWKSTLEIEGQHWVRGADQTGWHQATLHLASGDYFVDCGTPLAEPVDFGPVDYGEHLRIWPLCMACSGWLNVTVKADGAVQLSRGPYGTVTDELARRPENAEWQVPA